MKGGFKFSSTGILCLVAVALFQQIVTVSAVYTMSQTCAHMSQGWIADPNDCRSFGYCNNSVLVGTSQCPKGYVYNTRRAECQFPGPDVCSVGNVCQYADNSHVPNPSDCNSYYYCKDKSRTLLYCDKYQIYDSTKEACVWESTAPKKMCAANSICRLVPDGKFVGDPDVCGQYVGCISGTGIARKCPDGKFYNERLGGCQSQNPCATPTPAGFGLGVVTPLPDNPDACKKQPNTETSFVSDGKTCMGYYVCTSSSGPGAWRKCNLGLHFDNGKCVNAYTVPCPFDRCGNMNQEFVGAINTGCQNYLICKNQTSQAQTYSNYEGMPCPSNYPYFDEYPQKCMSTPPSADGYNLCPRKIN